MRGATITAPSIAGMACFVHFSLSPRGMTGVMPGATPTNGLAVKAVALRRFLAGEERIQRQTRLLIAVPNFDVRKGWNRDQFLLVECSQSGINASLRAHNVLLGKIVYGKAGTIPEVGSRRTGENRL